MSSVAKHVPDRQSALTGGGPQITPFGNPQRLSVVLHTPDWQARVPFATVHVPAMGAVAGSGFPFAVFAVHTPAAHHFVASAQSTSLTQVAPQAPVDVLH